MVAFNANAKETALPVGRFHEMLAGVKSGRDVITGQVFDLSREIRLPAKATIILEI
jgi:hypothetical protein